MTPPRAPSWWRIYRGPLVLLAVVLVAPWLPWGRFGYLVPLLQLAGIYTLLATSLTLLLGMAGQISLGHAGFFAVGAYTAGVAATVWHWPSGVAALAAVLAAGLVALLCGGMVLRLRGHLLALATLCLGVILYELILKSSLTGGAAGLYDLPEWRVPGRLGAGPAGGFYLVWGAAWLALAWLAHLSASPAGRALRAVRDDEAAAAALGVDVFVLKLKAFVASAMLAGVAGVLYAFVHSPSYLGPEEFGLTTSVLLVMMAVLGGLNSPWGGLVGALAVMALREGITLVADQCGFSGAARIEQLVYGLILILLLTRAPQGLVPLWRRVCCRAGDS
jgi:branched-chain amino acid transport system permease protein